MRELKYAILGLVNSRPITGYDIMKEFNERTMSNFWRAKHSQIYPELQKLVAEGALEYEIVIQGRKMEKKLYHITEKGKKDFLQWLCKDEPISETPKDPFRLRSYFCPLLSASQYRRLLESQLSQHQAKYDLLSQTMQENYTAPPAFGTDSFGDYIVLEGALHRERGQLEWLHRCLQFIG